jgi:hypothetical protein
MHQNPIYLQKTMGHSPSIVATPSYLSSPWLEGTAPAANLLFGWGRMIMTPFINNFSNLAIKRTL